MKKFTLKNIPTENFKTYQKYSILHFPRSGATFHPKIMLYSSPLVNVSRNYVTLTDTRDNDFTESN